ncbi:hypothetical protein Fcan01_09632 [Folsomia candida]|uniref:Uncharacterized protein n=1 Tax=Folsomia candida TaxID=158441 RepID=A0A226EFP2_FOLCA|nr:hypothetical protein Fcan01_09632 [Folsomia candida]
MGMEIHSDGEGDGNPEEMVVEDGVEREIQVQTIRTTDLNYKGNKTRTFPGIFGGPPTPQRRTPLSRSYAKKDTPVAPLDHPTVKTRDEATNTRWNGRFDGDSPPTEKKKCTTYWAWKPDNKTK